MDYSQVSNYVWTIFLRWTTTSLNHNRICNHLKLPKLLRQFCKDLELLSNSPVNYWLHYKARSFSLLSLKCLTSPSIVVLPVILVITHCEWYSTTANIAAAPYFIGNSPNQPARCERNTSPRSVNSSKARFCVSPDARTHQRGHWRDKVASNPSTTQKRLAARIGRVTSH